MENSYETEEIITDIVIADDFCYQDYEKTARKNRFTGEKNADDILKQQESDDSGNFENYSDEELSNQNDESKIEEEQDKSDVFNNGVINVQQLLSISEDEGDDEDPSDINRDINSNDVESMIIFDPPMEIFLETTESEEYIVYCPQCRDVKETDVHMYDKCLKCNIELLFRCATCDTYFASFETLYEHTKFHEIDHAKVTSKIIKCDKCKRKGGIFKSCKSFKEHLKVCGKPRLYQCSYCTVTTHEQNTLVRHIDEVHRYSLSTIRVCRFSGHSRQNTTKRIATLGNEETYVIRFCGFCKHTNGRFHVSDTCKTCPKCSKHTLEFLCTLCHIKCRNPADLRIHNENPQHTLLLCSLGENVFQNWRPRLSINDLSVECERCSTKFVSKLSLMKHQKFSRCLARHSRKKTQFKRDEVECIIIDDDCKIKPEVIDIF